MFSFQAHNAALSRVVLITLEEAPATGQLQSAGNSPPQTKVDGKAKLMSFHVSDAHCYDPNEQHKLRSVIAAVGTMEDFI